MEVSGNKGESSPESGIGTGRNMLNAKAFPHFQKQFVDGTASALRN